MSANGLILTLRLQETFANRTALHEAESKMEPLALVVYEKLLPGSQLVNRLQDLKYRVQSLNEPEKLKEVAEQTGAMVVIVDLALRQKHGLAYLAKLRQNAATKHVPVIGFGGGESVEVRNEALQAGATLVVSEAAILNHLEECLDQALMVE